MRILRGTKSCAAVLLVVIFIFMQALPVSAASSNDIAGHGAQKQTDRSIQPPVISLNEQDGVLELSWDSNIAMNKYTVYRKINASNYIAISAPMTKTSFEDVDLDTYGEYTYKVRAIDVNGDTTESNGIHCFVCSYGIIVGEKDSDEDGLPDGVESNVLKTDPNKADTDGDGFPDGYEYLVLLADPAKADTDGDGLSDGASDFDGDGLNNAKEYSLNTDAYSEDSDSDGLSDSEEVNIEKTDPLNSDSDEDGLPDGSEVKLGYKPLSKDSDGDKKSDSVEKKLQEVDTSNIEVAKDNAAIPEITIDAEGDVNLHTVVEDDIADPVLKGNTCIVGDPIDVETSNKFDYADIKFKINPSALEVGSLNDLVIYRYNEDTNTLEPVETKINTQDSSISATVTHFSEYMVVNEAEFSAQIKKIKELKDSNSIILSNLQIVKLKKPISENDVTTDSDGDSIPDIKELKSAKPRTMTIKGEGETFNVYDFKSNPAQADTDLDGYRDDADILPLIPFKTPVMLLHGRGDNSLGCFGLMNSIKENSNYKRDKSEDRNKYNYSDVEAQKITGFESSTSNKKEKPSNLGEELIKKGGYNYKDDNYTLYAFNYANKDVVNKNATRLSTYINNLIDYVVDKGNTIQKGSIFATYEDMKNKKYKFNFIGHSMGGLVSRYYIENLNGAEHANKLITIDTPHWGSGFAIIADKLIPMLLGKPCDVDLDPNGKIFGGKHLRTGDAYANKNQSAALNLIHENVKYYAIGGYDVLNPNSKIINSSFLFDVNVNTNNFDAFKNSITEGFYSKYPSYRGVTFSFGQNDGDDIVNNQSQLGVWFSDSGSREKVLKLDKASVNMDTSPDTFVDKWINTFLKKLGLPLSIPDDIFHCQNQHRTEVCDKVIEYLNEK